MAYKRCEDVHLNSSKMNFTRHVNRSYTKRGFVLQLVGHLVVINNEVSCTFVSEIMT